MTEPMGFRAARETARRAGPGAEFRFWFILGFLTLTMAAGLVALVVVSGMAAEWWD